MSRVEDKTTGKFHIVVVTSLYLEVAGVGYTPSVGSREAAGNSDWMEAARLEAQRRSREPVMTTTHLVEVVPHCRTDTVAAQKMAGMRVDYGADSFSRRVTEGRRYRTLRWEAQFQESFFLVEG